MRVIADARRVVTKDLMSRGGNNSKNLIPS